MTKLVAVYDDIEGEVEVATNLSKDQAAKLIEEMESDNSSVGAAYSTEEIIAAGIWPEAYDAVYIDDDGKRWVYTDGWEELNYGTE